MDDSNKKELTDEINTLVKSRIPYINTAYPVIRKAYKEQYGWPELDPLRNEICICLTFGLYHAGITLTNHLFETLFKVALIEKDLMNGPKPENEGVPTVKSFTDHVEPAVQKYGSNDLGDNINRAATSGLISKDQKKELQQFREDFRNAFSHSDKEKTFRGGTIGAQAVRMGEGGLQVGSMEESEMAKLIIAQGMLQAMQAESEAVPYFLYMDKLVRQVYSKLFPNHSTEGGGLTSNPS